MHEILHYKIFRQATKKWREKKIGQCRPVPILYAYDESAILKTKSFARSFLCDEFILEKFIRRFYNKILRIAISKCGM